MYNPYSLIGKTILVTGASSGIGRAIAIECSKMGADIIITGRNKERLSETLDLLTQGNHNSYSVELIDIHELENFVSLLPELDGFVSCAGMIQQTLIKFVDEQEINNQLQTNLLAPVHLTRLLVQNKKVKKRSSFVYISSINGNNCAYIGSSIYGMTKSALSGFTKEIALELAPRNIRVNSVNPGMIETNLLQESVFQENIEKDKLKYPLKRYGKPQEVAYAVVYLLSDASQWVTGTSLLIDGGYTLQ